AAGVDNQGAYLLPPAALGYPRRDRPVLGRESPRLGAEARRCGARRYRHGDPLDPERDTRWSAPPRTDRPVHPAGGLPDIHRRLGGPEWYPRPLAPSVHRLAAADYRFALGDWEWYRRPTAPSADLRTAAPVRRSGHRDWFPLPRDRRDF